ncbi:probable peroxisomal membrane protein PEX13 isoform X2 [Larimichthys crocea]|uniref:probable peroxisomal membrane protein PEX13 isoform X2 n=1 Tax=Larimichthys crocea TaxID=215358 RepID=UPI0009014A2B|nr:probable peroxisomal membrane protein PEX13 isoform X2 [Larimichthys crocea]
MRVLWISCLLIGTITCVPVWKDYSSNNAGTSFMQPPLSSGHMFSGEGMSSSPGSSSSLPSLSSPSFGKPAQLPAPSHSSGYGDSASVGNYGGGHGSSASGYGGSAVGGSYGGYGSSASGYGDSAVGGSYGGSAVGGSYGGYGSSDSGYEGGSYGYVAPHDESSNFGPAIGGGAGYENPEPVFSDVSDLEPVYSYSSRSSYQRGQATFAQSRYTPGEPVPPFPVSRRSSKATFQPNAPAKAPTKGGF